MTTSLLTIRDLHITFSQPRPAVRQIDLDVLRGETLALVGESGSGKSMTARAVLGLLPTGATATGSIRLNAKELLGIGEDKLNAYRGSTVALIFQDPQSALNPVRRIGWQIAEAIRAHRTSSAEEIRQRALELLRQVEIPAPETVIDKYPHQLSGGQKQRIAIALALANDPELLIADEPTTALDVTVQREILALLRQITLRTGMGVLLITHNMGIVAQYADRVTVLRHGEVVETNTTGDLFQDPRHPYTRQLLEAVPVLDRDPITTAPVPQNNAAPYLEFKNVTVTYPAANGNPAFRAINNTSLAVRQGEVLGLVGESGSGKTTLGRVAAGLIRPTAGQVWVEGRDLATLNRKELRSLRRDLALIPQDPSASLNPRRTVGASIREPLDVHQIGDASSRRARVSELLDAVALPTEFIHRYPDELSGGQRQRIAIARALAMSPKLVIADEPTSALDVSVQAEVIELFRQVQQRLGFTSIFISHDLAVIGQFSDQVAVLRRGELMEYGPTTEVYSTPATAYTRGLLDAVPTVDTHQRSKSAVLF